MTTQHATKSAAVADHRVVPRAEGVRQAGSASVELALVSIVFISILLGIIDFGRWMFAINAASEATRIGARTAVVCSIGEPAVRNRMRAMLPGLRDEQIDIRYFRSAGTDTADWAEGCSASTCAAVVVQLAGVTLPGVSWFLPSGLPIPAFPTAMVRESLASVMDASQNPVCR